MGSLSNDGRDTGSGACGECDDPPFGRAVKIGVEQGSIRGQLRLKACVMPRRLNHARLRYPLLARAATASKRWRFLFRSSSRAAYDAYCPGHRADTLLRPLPRGQVPAPPGFSNLTRGHRPLLRVTRGVEPGAERSSPREAVSPLGASSPGLA